MKIENEFIKSIIQQDNPIPFVWQKTLNLWLSHINENLQDYYYHGEEDICAFEDFLLNTYEEFFSKELPKACLNTSSPFKYAAEDTCFIVMDGMSIREGVLINRALNKKGFLSKISYSLSSMPSDTQSYKEKIKSDLSNSTEFIAISNPKKILISGKEKYIWSHFPDVMLDKIQAGHTVITDLEQMYKIAEKIVFEILEQTNYKKIIILSDHGYIRSESGFAFTVNSEKGRKNLRDTFGNSRSISMEDVNNDFPEFIKAKYVIDFSGYYLVKSRFTWPIGGKYNIYLHGGVSLMECFVPVIEVKK
jgi:hypothetical protein